MKVTFILPHRKRAMGYTRLLVFQTPPPSLLRLGSSTPKSWDIELIDERFTEVKYNETDLVAITTTSAYANRAYEIADNYRKKDVKVIIGGIHASILPEEAIRHADSVVIGEADNIWKGILEDFKKGNLKKIYKVIEYPDLSNTPLTRWDLLKHFYFTHRVLQTSRGCPYNCEFCSVSKFSGRKVRHFPVEHIVNEIKNFKRIYLPMDKYFFILDDNIAGDPVYAEKLFNAIKPLNTWWMSQSSLLITKNDKLLKLAAESGCKALLFGFESVCQDALREMHKPFQFEEYKKSIKKVHDYGIVVEGAFIFGSDFDTKSVFKETVNFCYDSDLDIAQYTILTPLPGTELFYRLKTENRITTTNWDYYDTYHVVFKPKLLTAEELNDGLIWSYENFYSTKSILKRLIPRITKMGLLMTAGNLLINFQFKNFL